MDKSLGLYFMAIVPPPDLERKISQERIDFSEKFHCKAALKPPVHITLDTLFKVTDDLMSNSITTLEQFFIAQPPFELEARNYGFFENKHYPVVFIDVVKKDEIRELNSGLSRLLKQLFSLAEGNGTPYHPHFTIGYRDLSPDIFPHAKRTYSDRKFNAQFNVDRVCLFKHNSVHWEMHKEFPLGTTITE